MKKITLFGLILVLIASVMAYNVETDGNFTQSVENYSLIIDNSSKILFIEVPKYVNYTYANFSYNYFLDNTTYSESNKVCYQESSNKSTSCPETGLLDGYFVDEGGTNRYAYMAYAKPSNPILNVIWQVNGSDTLQNLSVPTECIVAYPTNISFRVYLDKEVKLDYDCWNGTNWYTIAVDNSARGLDVSSPGGNTARPWDEDYGTGLAWTNQFYGCAYGKACFMEEAIFWNISDDIPWLNVSLDLSTINNLTGTVSNGTANLSSSILNSIIDDCTCHDCTILDSYNCRLPIHIQTPFDGTFNATNFRMEYKYGLDFCSQNTDYALNISFVDLDDNAQTVDFNTLVDYYVEPQKTMYSNSTLSTANSFQMCVFPEWAVIQGNLLVQYENASTTFEYSTFNTTFSNETALLDLIVTSGTSQVIFTVNDENGLPVQDAYIKILQLDVGTNSFKTTEILRTDDNGQTIGNIVLIDAFYRFIIEYEGLVRLIEPSSGGIRVLSTTKTFTINLAGVDYYDDFDIVSKVFTSLTFTNSTGRFEYTWSDPNADMHQGCLRVVKRNVTSSETLIDTCTATTAGTIFYDIGAESAGTSYIASGYLKFPREHITDTLVHFVANLFSFDKTGKSQDGLFFSFLLILGLAFAGIPFPAISLILMIVGLIATVLLGFYKIGMGLVLALIVLVVIQFFRMRQ